MLKVLVVADDLTGANDTGALLHRSGFDAIASPFCAIEQCHCQGKEALSINTDSRSLSSLEAYTMVNEAVRRYAGPGVLVSKRIDSTLRGNIGSEMDGALDAMPAGCKAVVVASFPAAGRICVGGYVLVHGVPLELSDTADDLKTPVRTSSVADMIRRQSSRTVSLIPIGEVLKGSGHICAVIRESDAAVFVVDAVSEPDIGTIAEACVASGLPFICVDPGPFTLAVARQRFPRRETEGAKTLLVVGSLSKASRSQLDWFIGKHSTLVYSVDIRRLAEAPEEEAARGRDVFAAGGDQYRYLCITTLYSDRSGQRSGIEEDIRQAGAISAHIAAIAGQVVERFPVGLVYLCGGDIAKGFLRHVGAQGIDIIDEVMPLAVYGKIVGGACDGLPILTKGGMIGDETAIGCMLERVSGCLGPRSLPAGEKRMPKSPGCGGA